MLLRGKFMPFCTKQNKKTEAKALILYCVFLSLNNPSHRKLWKHTMECQKQHSPPDLVMLSYMFRAIVVSCSAEQNIPVKPLFSTVWW